LPTDKGIQSNFSVPSPGTNTVPRESVLAQLDRILTSKLAVLHAPAGYGKTTLLSQFYDRIATIASPSYLILDKFDRAPAHFLQHLLSAISNAGIALKDWVQQPGDSLKASNYKKALAEVCNQIALSGMQVVIMLDDFFEAETEEITEIVQYFIEIQPGNLHIVIASRFMPKLPLATLNLRKEAVILDVDQMRFNKSEVVQLLKDLKNLELDDENIITLAEKIEGWPIALQLIRIWQQEGKVRAEDVMNLSGETIEIADYLLEQVFNRLSEIEKQFALSTSILKRVNGDIANAICERSDCWKILRDFESRGLFVMPLDNNRSWYRYHTLFKEFLQQRLAWEGESHIATCHVQAAGWLARHHGSDEAIWHFLAAGAHQQAATLADELGGWRLIWNGQTTLLQTICETIELSIINNFPRLHLGYIYLMGRNDDVLKALKEMEKLKQQFGHDVTDSSALTTEIRTIEVVLAGYADQPMAQSEVAELEAAVIDPQHLDVTLLAMIYNFLLLIYLDDCRFNRSRAAADQSLAYYRAGKFNFALDVVRVHVAQSLVAEGRLSDAAVLCDMLVDESLTVLDETQALFRIIAADVAIERNDLQRAAILFDDAFYFLEEFGSWFNIYSSMYKTAATLARVNSGTDEAIHILEQAKATAAKRQMPRLRLFADLMIIQELLHANLIEKAGKYARRSHCFDPDQIHLGRLRWQLGQDIMALKARLLFAEGKIAESQQLIQQLPVEFTAGCCRRQIIDNLLLSSTLCMQNNNLEGELQALDTALSEASEERLKRVIIDSGMCITERIIELATDTTSPLNRHSIIHRLRQAHIAIPAKASSQIGNSTHTLTPRELDVLTGIGLGLSSPQIAVKLGLSENTVNHHRKNIYFKLNISSRSDAVAIARSMQLADN